MEESSFSGTKWGFYRRGDWAQWAVKQGTSANRALSGGFVVMKTRTWIKGSVETDYCSKHFGVNSRVE
jgi:hypothetical protein